MKMLYVLRHAKSSWENHHQTDFERPLNERGLLSAPRIGKLMRDKSLIPDSILSSPAARAKMTAEIIRNTANLQTEIKLEKRIYEASAKNLFEILSEVFDETENLLLVGHNPGLENLVESLTGEARAMPTAALVVVELQIESWKEISPACGKLCNLFIPKEIAD